MTDEIDEDALDITAAPDPATATPEQIKKYNNRSVERVVSMLNVLQESPEPMALVELHRSIRMAKATAFRYLWTLERHRYVERDGDGRYRLGLGFVGMQSRDLDLLKERARPWLEKLRDETGETVNLGVLDGNTVRYVEVAESPRQVRMVSPPGGRDPLYCTALGKAIAAQLPEARVRELLAGVVMPRRTPRSITSVDRFVEELEKVRQSGRAVDDQENEADGRCVAVGIAGTRVPAALSMSAPASRFPLKDVPRIARTLTFAAERLMSDPRTAGRTTRGVRGGTED
ncbi:IclR family transcriptional regulator [Jiangella anatolica]|uniref:Transcriptional regulator n=1 Tax=Jiangella anatolica TaxID=2670374 RepID=A0A2W2BL17_9ACTN|nr:IclR family transcriptional regulator [Jiangella anatolica]PZF86712.1 transcriptional regulator [Jiangella anatolica]